MRAVGKFLSSTGGGCSGSYIGNRTVLTSAHCLASVAQNCVSGWANSPVGTFTFADQFGDPLGVNVQTINVLGMAAHADAFGNRCTNPVPAAPCASTAPDAGPTTYYEPSRSFRVVADPRRRH